MKAVCVGGGGGGMVRYIRERGCVETERGGERERERAVWSDTLERERTVWSDTCGERERTVWGVGGQWHSSQSQKFSTSGSNVVTAWMGGHYVLGFGPTLRFLRSQTLCRLQQKSCG